MVDRSEKLTHPVLTNEEHEARAMLLGMRYHHGNGEPFYYFGDDAGYIDVPSMIDANTLVPLVQRNVPAEPLFTLAVNLNMDRRAERIYRSLQERRGKNPWK